MAKEGSDEDLGWKWERK